MIESRRTSRHERLGPVGVRIETLLRFLDVPGRVFFSWSGRSFVLPESKEWPVSHHMALSTE